jgi:hypothetical protein
MAGEKRRHTDQEFIFGVWCCIILPKRFVVMTLREPFLSRPKQNQPETKVKVLEKVEKGSLLPGVHCKRYLHT